jgi:hypothetical protein
MAVNNPNRHVLLRKMEMPQRLLVARSIRKLAIDQNSFSAAVEGTLVLDLVVMTWLGDRTAKNRNKMCMMTQASNRTSDI